MNKKRLIGISAIACFALAAVLFGWSLITHNTDRTEKEVIQKTTQRIIRKQQEAKAAGELLRTQREPVSFTRNNIAAFYFVNKELQSWTTSDIPVNEDILFSIDTTEQFVQLGNMWYVTKAYASDSTKIVTAVLIKKSYAYENDFLQPRISGFLHLSNIANVAPYNGSSRNVVSGIDGKPLFNLVFAKNYISTFHLSCRWIAVALVVIGLFLFFLYFAAMWAAVVSIGILILLRVGLFFGESFFQINSELFSSTLYANSAFIPSLGDLLLHALFAFFIAIIIRQQYKFNRQTKRSNVLMFGLALVFIGCVFYVLRSLILNSTIPLDLSKLDQHTAYTFISYGILILLFATLYLLLFTVFREWLRQRFKIKTRGYFLTFCAIASLFTLAMLEYYHHQEEELQVKVWADKIAMEHDPTAELFLNELSESIGTDTILKKMAIQDVHPDEIHSYLSQNYFTGYLSHYDLQWTICKQNAELTIDKETVGCRAHFVNEIGKYGTLISEQSAFYYLANDNGRNSYLGKFIFNDNLEEIDLYIEIDSKLYSGGEGYPDLLIEKGVANKIILPADYSYAKYTEGRLITCAGNYRYPYDNNDNTTLNKIIEDGYSHLIFRPDSRHVIIITRHTHTFWSLLIQLSYLFLVIAIGLFVLLFLSGIPLKWRVSKNAFQRKITILLILAFVISVFSTASGSIWYNVRQFRKNAFTQMEDKMQTVLTQLDYSLNNSKNIYDDVDEKILDRELIQLSNSLHIDVNLYDTSGYLALTSRMEVFEKQLQSERINRDAFEQLHAKNNSQFIHKEQIGNLTFYSVYATYYNLKGEPVAYVNLPYFSKRMEDIREASAVITAMINVYILALFIALLLGATLANRLLRPLEIVRRNMQQLDVTKKMEYIHYHEKDELGDLIRAYNQMVKDLEESTQKLAQSERESAWREMARQIAHEIKNPLTPMQLSIQHLVRLKKDDAPDWATRFDDLATALLEQIDTLAKTASEFSSFAKVAAEAPSNISLNNLLNDLRSLFDVHKNISFDWKFNIENAIVNGRSDQLSRIMVNLLTNAVQAIQENQNGKIRVTLSKKNAEYKITIEDNGKGVPEDLQARLFTPNFTTKSSGTGLGLAISKNIIEHEGGQIAYSASELGGACFSLWLPAQK